MAVLKRLQKSFLFSIEGLGTISPTEDIAIQKVTMPELKVDIIEHGENGFMVKTEGIASTDGELVLEALLPLSSTTSLGTLQSNRFYNVANAVYNQRTDTRSVNPYVNITIRELDVTRAVTRSWRAEDCICIGYKHGDLDATGNENLMQTLTFAVNKFYAI